MLFFPDTVIHDYDIRGGRIPALGFVSQKRPSKGLAVLICGNGIQLGKLPCDTFKHWCGNHMEMLSCKK
jgi:hypothetical protein